MNKNMIILAAALLVGFAVFKVVKGEQPATETTQTLPEMPTAPACATATAGEPVIETAAVEATPEAPVAEGQEPQLTKEEFEQLIADLVKATEKEEAKKAKTAKAQATTESVVTPEEAAVTAPEAAAAA